MARGYLFLSSDVIACIAGAAATACFGVKGMTATSMADGIVRLLKREVMSKGVEVEELSDGAVNIGLHIAVDHGINITTVGSSIISEVRYNVQRICGIKVNNIDIFVDSIKVG